MSIINICWSPYADMTCSGSALNKGGPRSSESLRSMYRFRNLDALISLLLGSLDARLTLLKLAAFTCFTFSIYAYVTTPFLLTRPASSFAAGGDTSLGNGRLG